MALTIEIDHAGFDRSLRVVADIARDHRLSAYDASYLELARRMDLPLGSLDGDLLRAARSIGIAVLPA